MERRHKIKAIILAGGLGTRLQPLTDKTPKPLLKIKGKPIVQHKMENLARYGITSIILSIGYKSEQIMEYFGDGSQLGLDIDYSVEENPLGTGGAIKEAAKKTKGRFIALNGDNMEDFDYEKMLAAHIKNKAQITIALYPVEDVTKFGIAELDSERIVRFIEKPAVKEAPSNLNNAGAYIFEPGVLDMLPAGKSSIEHDCFEKMAPKGVVYAYVHHGQWFPTDDLEKFEKAKKEWKAR
ncbi:nucleotidyltransferase family protein [Candidatus Woesearchaeota archaeon]|nr:nucleotidyltransferase family protein [Candidatus Woesearchaeota archaeon]